MNPTVQPFANGWTVSGRVLNVRSPDSRRDSLSLPFPSSVPCHLIPVPDASSARRNLASNRTRMGPILPVGMFRRWAMVR